MSDDPDCLGMCAIDGDVCTGCGRTLDQINAALDRTDVDGDADAGGKGGSKIGRDTEKAQEEAAKDRAREGDYQ